MNSNFENIKPTQKDMTIKNIYSVMKEINANVVIDDRLKRRSRNGGYIARPGEPNHLHSQKRSNA